jgi:hypothetical protein
LDRHTVSPSSSKLRIVWYETSRGFANALGSLLHDDIRSFERSHHLSAQNKHLSAFRSHNGKSKISVFPDFVRVKEQPTYETVFQ